MIIIKRIIRRGAGFVAVVVSLLPIVACIGAGAESPGNEMSPDDVLLVLQREARQIWKTEQKKDVDFRDRCRQLREVVKSGKLNCEDQKILVDALVCLLEKIEMEQGVAVSLLRTICGAEMNENANKALLVVLNSGQEDYLETVAAGYWAREMDRRNDAFTWTLEWIDTVSERLGSTGRRSDVMLSAGVIWSEPEWFASREPEAVIPSWEHGESYFLAGVLSLAQRRLIANRIMNKHREMLEQESPPGSARVRP